MARAENVGREAGPRAPDARAPSRSTGQPGHHQGGDPAAGRLRVLGHVHGERGQRGRGGSGHGLPSISRQSRPDYQRHRRARGGDPVRAVRRPEGRSVPLPHRLRPSLCCLGHGGARVAHDQSRRPRRPRATSPTGDRSSTGLRAAAVGAGPGQRGAPARRRPRSRLPDVVRVCLPTPRGRDGQHPRLGDASGGRHLERDGPRLRRRPPGAGSDGDPGAGSDGDPGAGSDGDPGAGSDGDPGAGSDPGTGPNPGLESDRGSHPIRAGRRGVQQRRP